MIALAAAVGASRFVYTPILPVMAEALNLTRAQAGMIASANFLGYLLGALLAAVPGLPGPRRGWLLGALVVSALTTGAMGMVSAAPEFLLLRFVGGGASAFVLVLASAIVLEWLISAGRPGLSSVHFAGVGMGITLSALVVSVLLSAGADWRELWIAVGVVVVCAAALVAWLTPHDRRHPVEAVAAAPRRLPRGLGGLICAYGLFGFGYVVTATFLVAIVRASPAARGIEPLVWLVVGVTAMPSVAFWTRTGAWVGIRHAFSLACLVEAIGVAVSVLWPTATGALLAAALLGGTFMGLTALGLAEARVLAPSNTRPVFALMTAAFGFGQIVGPVLAGYLSDRNGGFVIPSLLAAAALVAASVIVQSLRPEAMTWWRRNRTLA
ncbi:MAG TPA: YbfB/YjiJ family MFS transporter [Rhodopila sp.]